MEKPSQVKEILYEEIKKISEKEIQNQFKNETYSKLIEKILEKSIPRISHISGETNEKLGILSESISHYILTEMLIPSQRKINYKNTEIDIVIPNLNTLKDKPDNAIILLFAKSSNIETLQKKIDKLQKIQTNIRNIWVISHDKMNLPCRVYILTTNENSFSTLFSDLKNFVTNKKLDKLKIFKT